eukprot:4895418-Amphidinium_carterae.1
MRSTDIGVLSPYCAVDRSTAAALAKMSSRASASSRYAHICFRSLDLLVMVDALPRQAGGGPSV